MPNRHGGYRPRERIIYEEDGGRCLAEVIVNNSITHLESYQLVVIQSIRPSPNFGDFEKGKRFKFERKHAGPSRSDGGRGHIVGLASDIQINLGSRSEHIKKVFGNIKY